MSADWFCKIGEKTYGPLNGQQLKTVVAKGQLQPEHMVRRGSEGPWLPAGKVKGLFPDRPAGKLQAKPLASAAGKTPAKGVAKAANLPTAPAAPQPPAPAGPQAPPANLPEEFSLGAGHKHHVAMNVDSLHIDAEPVMISSRKHKAASGLKKEEEKKLQVIMFSAIGGGLTIFLVVFIWALATGKFSSSSPPVKEEPVATAAPAVDPQKEKEKEVAAKKAEEKKKESIKWAKAKLEEVFVNTVVVKVIKPIRGAPPEGVDIKETDVLVLPVNLLLKKGEEKKVPFTSWGDDSLKDDVALKDDANKKYPLIAAVKLQGKEDVISNRLLQIGLVFPPPAKTVKYLHLELPASAVGGERFIGFEVAGKDVQKPANTDEEAAAATAKSDK